MSFLESVKSTLAGQVQPFLEAQLEEQKNNPIGNIGAAIFLVESIKKNIPTINIPKPPTPVEIFNGSYFKSEKMYQAAETGLIGTSGAGALAALVLLVTGLPGISVVTGVLSVGTLAGAYMAREAASQRTIADSVTDLRNNLEVMERNSQEQVRQITLFSFQNTVLRSNIEELSTQNVVLRTNIGELSTQNGALRNNIEDLSTQNSGLRTNIGELSTQNGALRNNIEELSTQNSGLRTNIEELSNQNGALRTNIEELSNQNVALRNNLENMRVQASQFAIQNQHYRTIANDFRGYVELFRTGAGEDKEHFARKLQEFTQQISASQELWRNFSSEANIFRENYATQIGQLRDLITQITDPRATLIRLEEHRTINEQIQSAVSRLEEHQKALTNLEAQIAIRDAQLRERDHLLAELRSAHEEILGSYRLQTATLGQRNSVLQTEISRISTLIDRHFDTTIEVFLTIPVPPNNVLAIRKGPAWSENVRFAPSNLGWTGRVPIGKEFKFVLVHTDGSVRWEGGANRMLFNPSEGQQDINRRLPAF